MRDPRKEGHEPHGWGCECCDEADCGKCEEVWPCDVVRAYDKWAESRPKAAVPRLSAEVEALRKIVDWQSERLDRQAKIIDWHERYLAGAVMPVIRDLLATHATGSLSVPGRIDGTDSTGADAFKGIGINFVATGGAYEYKSTDGRVYTDGRVTKGAQVSKVAEQRRRFDGGTA